MKKFLSLSLTLLLTFVITYAGSGINAYSFCCEDCHTYGVEAIAEDKCCDIHHDDDSSEQDFSDDNAFCESSHDQCTLERMDIDPQDISTDRNQTEISIKVLDISFATLPYLSNQITEDETNTGYVSETQRPPNLSKLVFFSLLETLII